MKYKHKTFGCRNSIESFFSQLKERTKRFRNTFRCPFVAFITAGCLSWHTLINVVLNIILIPSCGIEGAAIATAISYFTTNVLNSLRLYQKVKVQPFSKNYIKVVVSSLVMFGLVWILHLKVLNIWYAVLVLFAFLLIYFLIGLAQQKC